jgi:2,3-bisphosphoglycerate-dependent phosphoglycerate mutase
MLRGSQLLLIVVHENSLWALVRPPDHISDLEIVEMNNSRGIPLVYAFDEELQPIRHYYIGNEASILATIEAVASQSSVKK